MTRESLIKITINNLSKLPDQRIKEVADFTEFLLNKVDDALITDGIRKLSAQSKAFQFLEEDEELYSRADLKEVYK